MWWFVGFPPQSQRIVPGSFLCRWLPSGLRSPPTNNNLRIFSLERGSSVVSGGTQLPESMLACNVSASAVQIFIREVDKFFCMPCCAPANVWGRSRARLLHTNVRHFSRRSCWCCGDRVLLFKMDWTESRKTSCCNNSKARAAGPSWCTVVAPTSCVNEWWLPDAARALWSNRIALVWRQNSGSNDGGANTVNMAIGDAQ